MKTLLCLFAVGCATNTPMGSEPLPDPATPVGHIVAIGHDFTDHNDVMEQVLANAIALAPGDDIAISRFQGTAKTHLSKVFDRQLAELGRSWTELTVPPGAMSFAGNVVIVESQSGSAEGSYESGERLAPAFEELFGRGGVAIVLTGANSTSNDFAAGAGLYYQMEPPVDVTDQMLEVADPSDPVVRGVTQYRAGATSVAFPNTGGVIETADRAVVVHFTY